MRDERDIKVVKLSISASVEIDLERVQQDPAWDVVAREIDASDPAQLKQGLEQYISRYLSRESLLENAPFTNGPADIFGAGAEVL